MRKNEIEKEKGEEKKEGATEVLMILPLLVVVDKRGSGIAQRHSQNNCPR